MFGSLRFLLAYLVILSHLVVTDYVAHFRLLWPYYLVCPLTLAAIAVAPAQAAEYLKFWRGAPGLDDLLPNISVLPLQLTYASFRLIPPFWSVAIEIDMHLGVSRRMEWAILTLVAGLTFQLAWAYDGMGGSVSYSTAPAVMPFAIGAVLYFLHRRYLWAATPGVTALAFAAWLCNLLAGRSLAVAILCFRRRILSRHDLFRDYSIRPVGTMEIALLSPSSPASAARLANGPISRSWCTGFAAL
jgi:hypothetical protein